MASDELRTLLRPTALRLGLAWLGATGLSLLAPAIAWLAIEPAPTPALDSGLGPLVTSALHGCAVLIAAASLVARIHLLSDRRLEPLLREAGDGGGAGRGEAASRLCARERSLLAVGAWMWPPFLVGWLLNGAILAIGIALAVAQTRPSAMLPFTFAALALNVLACPRIGRYLERAERLLATRGEAR